MNKMDDAKKNIVLHLIKVSNMSKHEFSDFHNIERSNLYSILNGNWSPSFKTLEKMALKHNYILDVDWSLKEK